MRSLPLRLGIGAVGETLLYLIVFSYIVRPILLPESEAVQASSLLVLVFVIYGVAGRSQYP